MKSNDGLKAQVGGLIETKENQQTADKIAFKVKLDKKTKAIGCTDFVSFKNAIAQAFKIDISGYEIFVIDEDEDELLIESQQELEESLSQLGD